VPADEKDNTPIIGPAGAVHNERLANLCKYAKRNTCVGSLEPAKLLAAQTYKTVCIPPSSKNYACGWVVNAANLLKFPHNGVLGNNGSNTIVVRAGRVSSPKRIWRSLSHIKRWRHQTGRARRVEGREGLRQISSTSKGGQRTRRKIPAGQETEATSELARAGQVSRRSDFRGNLWLFDGQKSNVRKNG